MEAQTRERRRALKRAADRRKGKRPTGGTTLTGRQRHQLLMTEQLRALEQRITESGLSDGRRRSAKAWFCLLARNGK